MRSVGRAAGTAHRFGPAAALQDSDSLEERFAARHDAIMQCVPTDGFSARVIGSRWTDVQPLLPAATALFEDDANVVLLHEDSQEVGGLLIPIQPIFARAEWMPSPDEGPASIACHVTAVAVCR